MDMDWAQLEGYGLVSDLDHITKLAAQVQRLVIAEEVEFLTHWWRLRDVNGQFLYVGTEESFSLWKAGKGEHGQATKKS